MTWSLQQREPADSALFFRASLSILLHSSGVRGTSWSSKRTTRWCCKQGSPPGPGSPSPGRRRSRPTMSFLSTYLSTPPGLGGQLGKLYSFKTHEPKSKCMSFSLRHSVYPLSRGGVGIPLVTRSFFAAKSWRSEVSPCYF